jgi:hypothetical protein
MCQGQSLVDFAANARFEPFLPNAAPHSNGGNMEKTGRSICVRYAYS